MKTFRHMTLNRLEQLLAQFPRLRIAVVGDFFLDKYLDVDAALAEVSVETGKTAHQVVAVRHSPGAAGTVVSNLAALGTGTLHAVGLTGDDGESYELRSDLEALGCTTGHLHHDPSRRTPTYLKPRDATDPTLAGEHSRYDTKNRTPTSEAIQWKIAGSLDELLPKVDALIAADQVEEEECGGVTTRVRRGLADRAKRHPGVVFWADSRRRIRSFRGVIIKPNQFEAVGRENPPPGAKVDFDELAESLRRLRNETGAPVLATRGAEGIVVTDPELTLVPGVRVEGPTDPTGAGDSVTAGAVLALAAGAEMPEAALIGNLVASITIQQLATTGTARPDQLPPRLGAWLDQRRSS
ncbi:MAG: bifunctional heptose 7-phosphate kinase/heptose 1-phosphate adenyltransferase [Planctomycetota bacterium]|jgi:rfaE bifunctional protein kinase chain/domain